MENEFNANGKIVEQIKPRVLEILDGLSYGQIMQVLKQIELDIKYDSIFKHRG